MKVAQHFSTGKWRKDGSVPIGTIDALLIGTIDALRFWHQFDLSIANGDRSSLPGRVALHNANPALKCWVTFRGSLRDRVPPGMYPTHIISVRVAIRHVFSVKKRASSP
jgi:hypothetical protein